MSNEVCCPYILTQSRLHSTVYVRDDMVKDVACAHNTESRCNFVINILSQVERFVLWHLKSKKKLHHIYLCNVLPPDHASRPSWMSGDPCHRRQTAEGCLH